MNNKFFIKSIIFSFVLSGVLFFSVLLPCFPVHAATSSGELPYIVPLYRNSNSSIPDAAIETAIREYTNVRPSSVESFLMFTADGTINGAYYDILIISNPSVDIDVSDSLNFLDSSIAVTSNDYQICRVFVEVSNPNNSGGMSFNLGSSANLLGRSQTVDGFTFRYPFYYFGEDIYSNNDVLIFSNTVPNTPDVFETGHAVEPGFDSDSIIDSGLKPNLVPSAPNYTTYNITNYNAPAIDTSSVENLLKSIWDNITYLGSYIISNVSGFFNNLWNNLSLAFGYIGDLLSYLFNKVLNTIKTSVYNLYLNFKDLLEPVLNSFANMVNIFNTLYSLGLEDEVFNVGHLGQALFVPDQVELNQFLENHQELAIAGHAEETTGVLLNFMNDVIESDPIYEIHLPGFYFYDRYMGGYTISFDWYLDIKPTMDTIISGFLIVGYFFWLFVRLPGILHGTAPDSSTASHLMKDLDIKG